MPTAPSPLPLPLRKTKSSMVSTSCRAPSSMLRLLQASPRWRPLPIYEICLNHVTNLVLLLHPLATSWPPDVQGWPASFLGWPLLSRQPWRPHLRLLGRLHHNLPPSSTHCPLSQILSNPTLNTFDVVPLPRVTNKPRLPILLPPRSPIAHWARSHSNAPLALFAGCRPFHEQFSYHIPTAKLTRAPAKHLGFAGLCHAFAMSPKETNCFAFLCEALLKVNGPSSLSVLYLATGKFLEHHQLR
jgi:hypothetical protein